MVASQSARPLFPRDQIRLLAAGAHSRVAWRRRNLVVVSLGLRAVSYTHLRAHETVLDLVCRLLLDKKKHIDLHGNMRSHITN